MSESFLTVHTALIDPTSNTVRDLSASGKVRSVAHALYYRASGQAFVDRNWPHHLTSLIPIESNAQNSITEDWLTIPGFGSMCGERAGRLLSSIIPEESSITAMNISPDGSNPKEIKQFINDHWANRRAQRVSGYCHSMALLRLLWALRNNSDVHVDRLIIDGSPSSLEAVRLGTSIKRAYPVLERVKYRGGPIGKGAVALYREIDRNGFQAFPDRVRSAHKDTVTGTSPRRGFSELREFGVYGKAQLINHPELFPSIDGDTEIFIAHAEDFERDRSVDMRITIREIARFAAEKKAKLAITPVKDSGHAETGKSLAALSPVLTDSYDRAA